MCAPDTGWLRWRLRSTRYATNPSQAAPQLREAHAQVSSLCACDEIDESYTSERVAGTGFCGPRTRGEDNHGASAPTLDSAAGGTPAAMDCEVRSPASTASASFITSVCRHFSSSESAGATRSGAGTPLNAPTPRATAAHPRAARAGRKRAQTCDGVILGRAAARNCLGVAVEAGCRALTAPALRRASACPARCAAP